jgi:hypothetical protein
MRRFALHPVRFEQSFFRQPSKNGIDRALADDEIGEGFEVLDDGEAIARPIGNGEQYRKVETAAAELFGRVRSVRRPVCVDAPAV